MAVVDVNPAEEPPQCSSMPEGQAEANPSTLPLPASTPETQAEAGPSILPLPVTAQQTTSNGDIPWWGKILITIPSIILAVIAILLLSSAIYWVWNLLWALLFYMLSSFGSAWQYAFHDEAATWISRAISLCKCCLIALGFCIPGLPVVIGLSALANRLFNSGPGYVAAGGDEVQQS